ncbi:MAG: hypothetical protein HS115_11585 [Spirochaetales bacterium]|nr:hypothetical protein [Spirochaetales bacterium]
MTRAQLVSQIMYFLIRYFPGVWSVPDLALATGAPRRNVERALADMQAAQLIDKHYTAYGLALPLQNQIIQGLPMARTQMEKTIWLEKRKTSQPRISSSLTRKPAKS